jgi:phosphoserine aminotransferase
MVYNFNAGPGILPPEVLEGSRQAITDFDGTGLSILEIGHRTPAFEAVVREGQDLARELMDLAPSQEVLFLPGGATTQFFQVPMNFLAADGVAAYLDAGIWGAKAIKEARLWGGVQVVGSSREQGYRHIPKDWTVPPGAAYLHYTTNNTVEGTQMQAIPDSGVPLVADMSSDILSRRIDYRRFALLYAGAQKNLGAAGVTLVVVDRAQLDRQVRQVPGMVDYRQHAENGSMLNTPPVFAVYVCLLTLRWIRAQGGVDAVAAANDRKADLLYATLDALPLFRPTVDRTDRSRMNVVFVIDEPALEKAFLDKCKAEGVVGIRGHRSVGGFRISLYNALPLGHVENLTALMRDFAQRHG